MATTTIAELVKKLQEKDQSAEVEYIVVKTDGELVTALISSQAKPMANVLKMFKD